MHRSFLDHFGSMVVRGSQAESVASTNADVSFSLRRTGNSGVLFVRESANADQEFQATFPDPDGQRTITIPREGKLAMKPRAMKMLPV